jgi:hypothetical protein
VAQAVRAGGSGSPGLGGFRCRCRLCWSVVVCCPLILSCRTPHPTLTPLTVPCLVNLNHPQNHPRPQPPSGMQFMLAIMGRLLELGPDAVMGDVVHEMYHATLHRWHGWVASSAFTVGCDEETESLPVSASPLPGLHCGFVTQATKPKLTTPQPNSTAPRRWPSTLSPHARPSSTAWPAAATARRRPTRWSSLWSGSRRCCRRSTPSWWVDGCWLWLVRWLVDWVVDCLASREGCLNARAVQQQLVLTSPI